MTRVLWFSSFDMVPEQVSDLQRAYGEVSITKLAKRIQHASEIAGDIEACDVLCCVAPLELQAEFLQLLGDRPLLVARNGRVFTKDGNKVAFTFLGWDVVKEIRNQHHALTRADGEGLDCHDVLWFSRHAMEAGAEQSLREVYGDVAVTMLNKTISSVKEIASEIEASDVVCAILPPALLEQCLGVMEGKPFLRPVTRPVRKEDGTTVRVFDHWDVVTDYCVRMESLLPTQ